MKSYLAIIVFFITGLITIGNNQDWKKEHKVIEWDVVSYYGYLPSFFIYNDIALHELSGFPEKARHNIWVHQSENGGKVIKTSMGIAFLYSPFFLAAKFYNDINHYYSTGFEEEYKLALLLSSIVYASLGLILLKKILSRFFQDHITALTLLLIGLATNLYCYSSYEACMSHSYNFFLISSFIYITFLFFDKQSIWMFILLGISLGLVSLARPTNIIVLVFFVIYGINKKGLKNFIKITFKPSLLLSVIAFWLVWSPQIAYWYTITGQPFYFSYGNEKFYFDKPEIIKGLFSIRKGWFVYTPVMAISCLGLVQLYKEERELFWPVFVFTLINIYIIFSWWCWWYGGGFGQRPMIDSYAIMAIPLAAIIAKLFSGKVIQKVVISLGLLFFITLNVFQSAQYRTMAIHYDSMSWEAYKESFGKLYPTEKFWSKLDPIDEEVNSRLPK